ncbi:nucleotidyltransferase family protein [Desulfoferrobacter suflitae]|uniref:nucleotidyltransferase family protein n=1 Tax=Desulfoferrobacter suflitae TaxID=2865782 RepID=UPI0021648DF8|nr:nucleotidyltransferase domain-containing protein [Desulfoferrobacter suflitae]MCK8604248.1 nucleotidyltransferase domain-containing protein [Desulfoferrobacter suflitae]
MTAAYLAREEVLGILKRYKAEFAKQYGVTALGLFGSVARGESTAVSDVDVVVRMREPNLFYMVHIKDTLEGALHGHVDIIHYRKKMNPFLKKRIDRDAVYV